MFQPPFGTEWGLTVVGTKAASSVCIRTLLKPINNTYGGVMMCSILKLIFCRTWTWKFITSACWKARGGGRREKLVSAMEWGEILVLQFLLANNTLLVLILSFIMFFRRLLKSSGCCCSNYCRALVRCTNNDNYSYTGSEHINNIEFSESIMRYLHSIKS